MNKVLLIAVLCFCSAESAFPASQRKMADILSGVLPGTPLSLKAGEQVAAFLSNQLTPCNFIASGISNSDYLRQIERQVRAFYPCQQVETGAIIDPVYHIEWQYSTPCYALSVGLLVQTGYVNDDKLLRSGVKALDCSVSEMYENRCAHHHGEFFIQPIMLALDLYETFVSPAQLRVWLDKIASVDPYILYKDNLKRKKYCYNHNVVALSGEVLRQKKGVCKDAAFLDIHLKHQQQYLSEFGMYIDNRTNPPMAYDEFTRQFLASILVEGYQGECAGYYSSKLLDGAWTSLLMQSPYGEVPTGGRSAQHLWNEAAATVTYEIYASQYAAQGRMQEAGAFKRAAHLALKSISRWERPDGSGYIVKNRFPVTVMHGYESYSAQSQYNLLACWLMAVAYLYADDTITEKPAPADVGGYVLPVHDVFHKVFANAGGNYVEYELSADPRYNATGLIRVHLKGSNPQLGPSDGIPRVWDNKKKKDMGGELYAVGPEWRGVDGKEHRLAEFTNLLYPDSLLYSAYVSAKRPEVVVKVLKQAKYEVCFEVRYTGDFAGVNEVVQTITVNSKGVTVADVLSGSFRTMNVCYPVLIGDGEEKTRISIDGSRAELSMRDGTVSFQALFPRQSALKRVDKRLSFRNGYADIISFDVKGKRAVYRISPLIKK